MRVAVFLLGLSLAAAPQPAAAEPHTWHGGVSGPARVKRLVAVAIGGLLFGTSELVVKDAVVPDTCRWCRPPAIDTSARDALVWVDRGRADTLSNLTGYLAAPVVGIGVITLAASAAATTQESRIGRVLDDTLPIVETVVYSQLLVQVVKFAVARQRPRVRFAESPAAPGGDDNVSFFSGHSALAFAIATSAGVVAHRRGYRSEPVIWSAGFGLALGTAYLRIAADEHYLTDVTVGAVFGVGMGLLIPRLLAPESQGRSLTVVPGGRGIALAGRF
jgi:membrane-associated phospholipid phosphatase